MEGLEHDTKLVIEWFENNYLKLNEDKCHLLLAGHRYETLEPNIEKLGFRKVRMKNYLD